MTETIGLSEKLEQIAPLVISQNNRGNGRSMSENSLDYQCQKQ